jgi:AraC-like DNA-binding protein
MQERARLGGYTAFATPADLRHIVVEPWSYWRPHDAPPLHGRGHRLVPDGNFSLAFMTRRCRRNTIIDARVVIAGPLVNPQFFAPAAGDRIDAVRLHPEWCADLFGIDPSPLFDTVKAHGGKLLDRLLASPAPLQLLLVEVRQRSERVSRDAALVNAALRHVRQTRRTTLELGRVARTLAISERQLRRLISDRTTFSAKRLHRMARVARAIATADREQRPDWARIAHECGFYDQSHMIGEAQLLAGCPPAELIRERRRQQT